MIEKEPTITINDIDLALYHHIVNGKIQEWKEINQFALAKYTTKNPQGEVIIEHWDVLYWYLWWIQLEETEVEWSLKIAEKNINKWREFDSKNPMIHFVLWKLQLKKEEEKKALSSFEKTIALWTIKEFSRLAQEEIEKININK
jgi:hypothetical protein